MARVVGQKTAIGSRNGDCQGCIEPFAKGNRMTGVSEGREFKGWFCDECIRKFDPPVYGAAITERPEPLFTDGRETEPKGKPHGHNAQGMDRNR